MIVSIFNDVIGPVMRGPSSSHCAAALRIGRLARDLMDGDLQDVRIEFDRFGSLATTYTSQGSDMGLSGGLLGWDAADARLPRATEALEQAGIHVRVGIADLRDEHPNTYHIRLGNRRESHSLTAVSTGGGMIGVFIAARSTFAAEIAGCQAECGSAASMAAAALVTLAGGSTVQSLAAASMALQNSMGWTCDPVAGRVEVPCLGKNVLAAGNALACANMALAGYEPVIPLDEVIAAADHAGRSLPRELRCTALGGLSSTPTARQLEQRLNRR